jgi:ADP-heptose:LPS heptosyltransferase
MVKFLIIRFSSIGDIVLTTPVVRAIKTQVEDSEVHFLTKPGFTEILTDNPYINKIHTLSEEPGQTIRDLAEESFDYIIDLQNNLRSRTIKRSLKRMYFTVNKINVKKWLYVKYKIDKLPKVHIVDRYMATTSVFDIQQDNEGLDYYIPDNSKIDVSSLGSAFSKGFIALAIGAKHNTKKIPPDQISDIISKISHPVILIGGPEDKDDGEKIKATLPQKTLYNGCGSWSINQSASIISQSNCVIAPDTGMMHVAAAFKKKIITIWGNTTPRFGMYSYLPDSQSVDFEVENLKCRPCSKLGKENCPKKHFKCMTDHDSGAIAAAANKLF